MRGSATSLALITSSLNNFQKEYKSRRREIDVVAAFGGEQCLRMLGSIRNVKEYPPQVVYLPEGHFVGGMFGWKVRRDFQNIFKKGVHYDFSEKNRLVHSVPKRQRVSEKKSGDAQSRAEKLSGKKAEKKPETKGKSEPRKGGASALRRKLQRRERALEKVMRTPEKDIQVILSPQVAETSVSGKTPAKEDMKEALSVLAERQDTYFKRMRELITNEALFTRWLEGTSPTSLRANVAEYGKQLKALQVRVRWIASGAGVTIGPKETAVLRDIFK
jgi:hypothetical protein